MKKIKNVLILSASKGIGFAIAELLSAENYNVIITSSNINRLNKARNKILKSTKKNIHYFKLDINSKNFNIDLEKILKFYKKKIDILILNSPGPKYMEISKISIKDIQKVLNNFLLNQIYAIKKILPLMKKNKFGRIINLSSTLAKEPNYGMSLSTLYRSSLMSFCKCVSIEYGKYGITANTILTGGVLTERLIKLLNLKDKKDYKIKLKKLSKQIPVNFIATAKEFSYIFSFLVSEKSKYLNGTSLPLDGGLTKTI